MIQVYSVDNDGSTHQLKPVVCKNEGDELQLLLERNPNLLPGEQIRPDDPRRWLVIQREMSVPDPSTGQDRWSIDFLFADQDAIPTFIEVKRFEDTRSRREVIGQMFEYAANGHYYWTKDELRDYAEKTAERLGATLEDRLSEIAPDDFDTVDAFFDRLQDNLREGQVRLVFFLEQSPMELRSLVDFLNRQMERSEILLVEARLFEQGGKRFVVPSLFGYSEEARRVKRVVTISSDDQGPRKQWNEDSYFAAAAEQSDVKTVDAIRRIFDYVKVQPFQIRWGTGKKSGSFGILLPDGIHRIFFVGTHGWLNFGFSREQNDSQDRVHQLMTESVGLPLPDDYEGKWPNISPEDWVDKVDAIIEACGQLLTEFGRN